MPKVRKSDEEGGKHVEMWSMWTYNASWTGKEINSDLKKLHCKVRFFCIKKPPRFSSAAHDFASLKYVCWANALKERGLWWKIHTRIFQSTGVSKQALCISRCVWCCWRSTFTHYVSLLVIRTSLLLMRIAEVCHEPLLSRSPGKNISFARLEDFLLFGKLF